MAGPLNGLGVQQQVPLSTTFKPGEQSSSNAQVRPEDDRSLQRRENTIQPRGTQSAESQRGDQTERRRVSDTSEQVTSAAADGRRGSLVDISV